MPDVKEDQAFRNQMNYEVQSPAYADTKSYNPFHKLTRLHLK